MTKRYRTILFFVFLALFFAFVPTLILYSQGYRLDWDNKRLTQTGGLYIKAYPKSAVVSIDGKEEKKTDGMFGSLYTTDLFAGRHNIKVEKEGYYPWEKTLDIQNKLVTEVKNLTLFPQSVQFTALSDKVKNFWASPDQSKMILQRDLKPWQLALLSLKNAAEEPFYIPSGSKDTLWSVQWNSANDSILFQLSSREQISSYRKTLKTATNNSCGSEACSLAFLSDIYNTQLSPTQPNLIVGIKEDSLYSLDTTGNTAILGTKVAAYAQSGTDIYWLSQDGSIWQKKLNQESQPLYTFAFIVQGETPYTLYHLGNNLFLQENQTLFHLKDKIFEKIFDNTSTPLLSPDQTKIAIALGNEIWIYNLTNQGDQPHWQKGDSVFLNRFSEPIQNLAWLNSNYLLFSLGESIKVMEIDNRDRLNIVEIAKFANPKTYWSSNSNLLYVLSNGKLYASEKIIR